MVRRHIRGASGRMRRVMGAPARPLSTMMTLFENALIRYAFIAVVVLVLGALLYFIFIGVRALFREARRTAREAGHREGSATVRAICRMAIWAAYFGAFYLLAFLVGKRLGWWAVPPVAAALVAMIWSLLLADRLLTVAPGDVRQQTGIGITVAAILAIFIGIIVAVA